MTRNSRLNSLSGSKNKRLLFKVVKTNWTHNNRPFLDTASQERDLLVRLAKHLKSRLDSGLVSCMGAYRSVLDRLSSLDSTAAKGAQVRSRVKWVEEGEVSSAFFFRLEKKRSADRWISALRNPNGSIVSSPSDLCASWFLFFLVFCFFY